ncbi:MAG: UDP-3-O-(3-hydroxymyristoyl)glucosamine N-acyltransferase [Bacteroidetes bacterium]|nr:MAG: UDP-3-O-(3-hydroxymyristoyl)glucosamine N-acyltransferase [Bacteroidota bacterium]
MEFSISQIAALIEAEVEGDPTLKVHDLSRIEAGRPGTLTFLANPKYTPHLYTTEASAVIVAKDLELQGPVAATLLRVEDPYLAFTRLLEQVAAAQKPAFSGVHPTAYVDPSAQLGADVVVGPMAYIGPEAQVGDGCCIYPQAYIGARVRLGSGTTIHPQVSVYHDCEIGSGCIIHAGTVIGSDGFGFAPQADGSQRKVPQTGIVRIEDDVEIGANCCIDRATMGATLIRTGVKLDNLVQLAHNVDIGQHTVIAAQTGIAGSTTLGENCMLGGQVGVVGHLNIAARSMIDAQSGVNRSLKKEGAAYRGSPVQPHRQQLKSELLFRKLEDIYRRLEAVEQALTQDDLSA